MSALVLTTGRVSELVRALAGALRSLGNTQGNQLVPLTDEDYDPEDHHLDPLLRQAHRSGMLLNSDEVVALAHLPTASEPQTPSSAETLGNPAESPADGRPQLTSVSGTSRSCERHAANPSAARRSDSETYG